MPPIKGVITFALLLPRLFKGDYEYNVLYDNKKV